MEETIGKQEDRIEKYHRDEDRHFTEEGRVAEITTDLVLEAWIKMAEERFNRPEDFLVTEMMKQLPQEIFTRLQGASETVLWVWKTCPALGRS